MSTLNGCGTLYYGWKFLPDGSATATKWISVFYLPIVPIARHKIAAVEREGEKNSFILVGTLATQKGHVLITGEEKPKFKEVVLTYAKAYLALPLLMCSGWIPMAIYMFIGGKIFQIDANASAWFMPVGYIFSFAGLANFLWWPVWAVRKSYGKPPNTTLNNGRAKDGAPVS